MAFATVFGRIVRYLGFYHAADGTNARSRARAEGRRGLQRHRLDLPEGTRSADGRSSVSTRAPFTSRRVRLDILPICLYGNGMISSKRQPIYISTDWS